MAALDGGGAPDRRSALVETRTLVKRHYARGLLARSGSGTLAVDRVSLEIERARVFGLVGESGCGKSTLARAMVWLDPPTSGDVLYDGVPLGTLDRRGLRALRRRMQIVFQDPNGALDPRMRVRLSMEEGLVNIGIAGRRSGNAASTSSWSWSASLPNGVAATRTSSPAARSSASSWPARLPSLRSSWSWTSRSPTWTYPSRRRSSTFSWISRSGSP